MSAARAWLWLRRLRRRATLSQRGITLSLGLPGSGLRLVWRHRWPRASTLRRRRAR